MNVPRRLRIDLMVPAEKAILDAVHLVEALPADVRLTWAVALLAEARNMVADYVDGEVLQRLPVQKEST